MTIFAPSESDKYNKHLKGMDSDYELPDVCEKVDYTDGDVMIIDNVRHLEEQYQRLPSQNLIILCCKGRMQLDVNGRTLSFGENEVLFSSPGAMLSGFMFSADFDCKILCLSNRIIQELLRLNIETWNRAVYVHRMNIVRLPDEEVTQFNLYYALIRHKMMQKEQRGSTVVRRCRPLSVPCFSTSVLFWKVILMWEVLMCAPPLAVCFLTGSSHSWLPRL